MPYDVIKWTGPDGEIPKHVKIAEETLDGARLTAMWASKDCAVSIEPHVPNREQMKIPFNRSKEGWLSGKMLFSDDKAAMRKRWEADRDEHYLTEMRKAKEAKVC